MIGECRGLALGSFQLRAFDPVHRVAPSDRVAVQQIVEQAAERGEFAPLGSPGQAALFELAAPGEDVGASDFSELFRGVQTDKLTEVLEVALVGASGTGVGQVGKPFDGRRYLCQVLEFSGRQPGCGHA